MMMMEARILDVTSPGNADAILSLVPRRMGVAAIQNDHKTLKTNTLIKF
jgi:hypothetical protein